MQHIFRAFLSAVALLILVAAIDGCDRPVDASAGEGLVDSGSGAFTYSDISTSFAIEFPTGWTVSDTVASTKAFAVSPVEGPDDRYQENIGIVYETVRDGTTLDEYVDMSIWHMRQSLDELTVGERKTIKLAGREARSIRFTHSSLGLELEGIGYMFVNRDQAFVVVCNGTRESFSRYEDVFEKAAKSLELDI